MDNENNSAAAAEEVTQVTGGQEPEIAAPAESADAEGEKAQEITEPAGATGETQTKPMSSEERHQQAQARREAQQLEAQRRQDAEIDRRVQEEIDRFVAKQQKTNPKTGKLITTKAEYDEVQADARRQKREDALKKAGLDPSVIEEMINEHPDVKAAKAAQAEAKAAKNRYDKLTREEAAREELRKIQRIDPNIKCAEDLMAHPKYAEIRRLVQENNHTIADAFDIATKNDRATQAQVRAQSSAAAVKGSKTHMVAASGSSTGGNEIVSVPAHIAAMYRKDNPRLNDEQIRAKYGAYLRFIKK